jgi:ketosteroid isomerase-like protein
LWHKDSHEPGEFVKRTIISTTAFLIIATATIVTAQSHYKNIEQEFMRLHRAEEEAESKKDVAALDRLLNEDFVFVAANGSISDKKKFLDEIKGDDEPPAPQENLTYEDFKVRIYGTTAIVNYVLLVSGKDKDGKDYANRYRMSVVWVKQRRDWRISNFHTTRVRS